MTCGGRLVQDKKGGQSLVERGVEELKKGHDCSLTSDDKAFPVFSQ